MEDTMRGSKVGSECWKERLWEEVWTAKYSNIKKSILVNLVTDDVETDGTLFVQDWWNAYFLHHLYIQPLWFMINMVYHKCQWKEKTLMKLKKKYHYH